MGDVVELSSTSMNAVEDLSSQSEVRMGDVVELSSTSMNAVKDLSSQSEVRMP
jgi:hypothetical protein